MLHVLGQGTRQKSCYFFPSALSDSCEGTAGAGLSLLHCCGPEFKAVVFAMGMAPTGLVLPSTKHGVSSGGHFLFLPLWELADSQVQFSLLPALYTLLNPKVVHLI